MDNETLTQKVLSSEEKINSIVKRQKQIEDETREGFSQIMKVTKSLSSTLLKSMESDRVIDDLVTQNDERLTEIEDKFEDFQEEITNKLAWETDVNIEEMEKVLNSLLDQIKFNRDAINAILKYMKKKDKITIWEIMSTLTTLRGLVGIP